MQYTVNVTDYQNTFYQSTQLLYAKLSGYLAKGSLHKQANQLAIC